MVPIQRVEGEENCATRRVEEWEDEGELGENCATRRVEEWEDEGELGENCVTRRVEEWEDEGELGENCATRRVEEWEDEGEDEGELEVEGEVEDVGEVEGWRAGVAMMRKKGLVPSGWGMRHSAVNSVRVETALSQSCRIMGWSSG